MAIELLLDERIERALEKNALRGAHMNLFEEIEGRVVGIIEKSRAKSCVSLSLI